MKYQHLRPAITRARLGWWPLLCAALLAAVAAQPAAAGVFPDGEAPYTVVDDDFEGGIQIDNAASPWMNWKNVDTSMYNGSVTTLSNAGCATHVRGGVWGANIKVNDEDVAGLLTLNDYQRYISGKLTET